MNCTSIQKYNPATPIKEKSNQIAERKIFLAVTANRPATSRKTDNK